ncbi:ABC transporter ATP-binding protein [Haloechinothrix sp. LS1_15]|nr:ABC transporter ATP-binding protein [Haloechinothrix sp. LS1_15]
MAMSGIGKSLGQGATRQRVLDGMTVDVYEGQSMAILGRSGSGKSTLLSLMALFDSPDEGYYELDGRDVTRVPDAVAARLRSDTFGFVFQRFYLLHHLTAEENVAVPLLNGRDWTPGRRRRERARAVLAEVGLSELASRYPAQLSGGEQQRVAIARALLRQPRLVLADEPVGSLDSVTGSEVIELLRGLTRRGCGVVMVTHDESYANRMDRVLRIADGRVVSDGTGGKRCGR